MLVTVGLLVPTQWFAFRTATRAAGDSRFPISAWTDPRYFSTSNQARTVQPLSRGIIDEVAADASNEPAPGSSPQPSPSPSGGRKPTPTPTPSPSQTNSPTPRPVPPPRVEIRADHIDAPDGSGGLFYRWRIRIENPSGGDWIDDVETLTQVPIGMNRVDCGRGVGFDAAGPPNPGSADSMPGTTCHAVPPASSNDGHDVTWSEAQLGPGHVRVYTFEVRVTAGNGATIRNHAHLNWNAGSLATKTCEFVVQRSAPKGCSVASG